MKVERQAFIPAEVAELLGVSRRTVYTWIKGGHLPAVKVGPKLWLVPLADLQAFTKGRGESAAPPAAAPPAAARSGPVDVGQPLPAPATRPVGQVGKKKRRR